MQPVTILILMLYLLEEAAALCLTAINAAFLKKHGQKVPPGFEKQVDREKLCRMSDYSISRTRVTILASLFSMSATVLLFFCGLLDWYNGWLAAMGLPPWIDAVLFFLLLFYAGTILQLPFDLYSTFKVEERFGFNRQTIGLWLIDHLKSWLLGTVLLSVMLAAAFWLIRSFPAWWWLVIWLLFCFFSVVLMYLLPYVIEPLFNTFVPVADKELENRLQQLMERAGLKVSRVLTMDVSKRSGHSNAYFSGIGRVKRIVLFDTLLVSHSHDEIAAILAHEAGHWKKKHVLKSMLLSQIIMLCGCYGLFALSTSDWLLSVFAVTADAMPVRILLAGFLLSLLARPLSPFSSLISRYHEREADSFAVKLTGGGKSLASALIKLGADNLANLHPHPLYAAIYYSHPPLVARVQGLLSEGRVRNEE